MPPITIPKRVPVNCRFPRPLVVQLTKRAKHEGRTRTAIMEELLRNYLRQVQGAEDER